MCNICFLFLSHCKFTTVIFMQFTGLPHNKILIHFCQLIFFLKSKRGDLHVLLWSLHFTPFSLSLSNILWQFEQYVRLVISFRITALRFSEQGKYC